MKKYPMYIGFLVNLYNPLITNFFGGSIGAGVPLPIFENKAEQ